MPIYDVVNKYSWTSVPKNTPMRREAPRVIVVPLKLIGSQLSQYVAGYLNIGAVDAKAFYRNLYKVKKTDIEFQFPYLSDNIKSFGNTFSESFSNFSSKGAVNQAYNFLEPTMKSMVGAGLGTAEGISYLLNDTSEIFNMLPDGAADKMNGMAEQGRTFMNNHGIGMQANAGAYLETPQLYQFNNNDAPLEVSFTLSNTIDPEDALMNKQLIDELAKMNKPRKISAIQMTYPHIYRIMIPGQRYMYWAYMNNFNVSMIGNRREIEGKLIPEGYNISMSFKSLIIETANFVNTF